MATITNPLPNTHHKLYGSFWRISMKDRFINGDISDPIYCNTHGQDLVKHIARRNGVTLTTISTVDWNAVGRAAKNAMTPIM